MGVRFSRTKIIFLSHDIRNCVFNPQRFGRKNFALADKLLGFLWREEREWKIADCLETIDFGGNDLQWERRSESESC